MNDKELKQKIDKWLHTTRDMTPKENTILDVYLRKYYNEHGWYPIRNAPKQNEKYIGNMNCHIIAEALDYYAFLLKIKHEEFVKNGVPDNFIVTARGLEDDFYDIATELYGIYNKDNEKMEETRFIERICLYLLAKKYNKLDELATKDDKDGIKGIKRLHNILQLIDDNECKEAVDWANQFKE